MRRACFAYQHPGGGDDFYYCTDSLSECESFHAVAVDNADMVDVGTCRFVSRAPGDVRWYLLSLAGVILLAGILLVLVAGPISRYLGRRRDDAWRRRNL